MVWGDRRQLDPLRCALLACVVTVLPLDRGLARNLYVNATGGDDAWTGLCETYAGGDCGPKATLRAALNAAIDHDTIFVADGVYTGIGNVNLSLYGLAITLRSSNGPDNCSIDCAGLGRAFYLETGETAATVIEGFTITGGDVPYGAVDSPNGGAIRCDPAHPTIRNCVFVGNVAAGNGGAVYCGGSYPTIENCTFESNTAGGSGGGLCGVISNSTITGCTFVDNVAVGAGGGAMNFYAAMIFKACTFVGNAADIGGGLCANRADSKIINCHVAGNSASDGGGIALYFTGIPELTGCVIAGNRAVDQGGGVWVDTPTAPGIGNESRPRITSCTFTGNRAALGGGIMAARFSITQISNSVFWNDAAPLGPEIAVGPDTSFTIVYSALGCATGDVYVAPGGIYQCGVGTFEADPLFLLEGAWDDAGTPSEPEDDTWTDGDYQLQQASPCVDAGDNESRPVDQFDLDDDGDVAEPLPIDIAGAPRSVDDRSIDDTGSGTPPLIDIGAHEYQPDCDGNGVPDYIDIADGTLLDDDGDTVPDSCEPKLWLVAPDGCDPDHLVIDLALTDAPETVVGGQFFLDYDPTRLAFVSATPGAQGQGDPENPFEREIYEAVDEVAGTIDYLVGIADGDVGTEGDALMARFVFAVVADDCAALDVVTFAAHTPPTRLSGAWGDAITPDLLALPAIPLDSTPPELAPPADVTVRWHESTAPAATGVALATDLCDPAPEITYLDEVVGDEIWREWTATDACGNAVSAVQVITILPVGDCDADGYVAWSDFALLGDCLGGPDVGLGGDCDCDDLDADGDVDLHDLAALQRALAAP
jgi:predicted outer membrane repeat protein